MSNKGFKIICLDCGSSSIIEKGHRGTYRIVPGGKVDLGYLSIICYNCFQELDTNVSEGEIKHEINS